MTSRAIRQVFMRPRNSLRTQEALLSRPVRDLFRGTPVYWPLRAFRGTYYAASLLNLRRCVGPWRRRRRVNGDRVIEGTGADAPV